MTEETEMNPVRHSENKEVGISKGEKYVRGQKCLTG